MPLAKRAWSTPINSATMRKRSKLFVDGRLLVFPAALLIGALFVPGSTSLYFIGIGIAVYALLKALFLRWPWFLDDMQAELAHPYELADIGEQHAD